eukprot:TRINITY_DN57335_c0_g1_i1.p1 TRINITY_DN57335_c0_g1~~TRINITY_DN57335_c0_g1_i1.p1  ORF type:complete len:363 (+),score=55.13 TRINITY_DN57335_c0_g1_i1:63-1091(+)
MAGKRSSILTFALMVLVVPVVASDCQSGSLGTCEAQTSEEIVLLQEQMRHVTIILGDGELNQQQPTDETFCDRAPQCLEPGLACLPASAIVRASRPECRDHEEFCDKVVYRLPVTGLVMTLPVMRDDQLMILYQGVRSSTNLNANSARPREQAEIILEHARFDGEASRTIVEMGCAGAYLLYKLRNLAGAGGVLRCFEVDTKLQPEAQKTLHQAKEAVRGLKTELIPTLVDFDQLAPESVDVFQSSHVVEHLPDPCPFLRGLMRALKPGGFVFTEVPDQEDDPKRGITRGVFHLLYFNTKSFVNMMKNAGFEEVFIQYTKEETVRTVFRKPSNASLGAIVGR